jgi:hypothetical protein
MRRKGTLAGVTGASPNVPVSDRLTGVTVTRFQRRARSPANCWELCLDRPQKTLILEDGEIP